jgi:tRNA threonylcarbamoyladenosine biosynthesis protein TsaE
MATFISHSPAETESLGEEWGRAAEDGWVIGVSGDLGAGKTQLVKGLARGLNVAERVHSPTFALLNEYSGGRLPLFHIDLYRLENREQIIGAGLEEYFYQPRGVAVVEWIERWGILDLENAFPNFGTLFRSVKIEVLNENDRRITYEDFGR